MRDIPQLPGHDGHESDPYRMVVRPDDRQFPSVRYPNPEPIREAPAEPDDIQAIMQLLQIFWRHKWVLTASLVLGGLAAVAMSLRAIPTYRAQATMRIESFQEPFAGVFAGQDPTLVTEQQLMTSKQMRGRAAAKLNSLGTPPLPKVEGPLTTLRTMLHMPEPLNSIPWESAVAHAAGTLQISIKDNSRIVQVQSDSVNPRAAADYVNTLMEEYIAQNLEQRWEGYQATGEWLNRAQEDLKVKLEKSEQQLSDFAKSAGLLFLSGSQNISEARLGQTQAELAKAQADRIKKEALFEANNASSTESESALPEVLDQGPIAQYTATLTALKQERAQLLVKLTKDNPKVLEVQAKITELENATVSERGNIIRRFSIELDTARRQELQLEKNFKDQATVVNNEAQKLIYYNILKREVETNRELYLTTVTKGKEASVASSMKTNNARVVDKARVPESPETPRLPFNVGLGSMGGLFCAAIVVLVRARSDVRIQSPTMLGAQLSLRELGVIPSAKTDPEMKALIRNSRVSNRGKIVNVGGKMGLFKKTDENNEPAESLELVTWTRNRSILAEAYRATMTSILFSNQNGASPKVLLLTSPSPQDGKSTVISNLAIALAEIGQRVLIIDGDMRLPRLHTIFDVPNTFGLSDMLSERTPVGDYSDDMLVRKTAIPGLHVVPAGPARSDLSRLLYSPRVKDLLTRFRSTFDIVLIDSAPVLSVPDSRILARWADAVILVVRAHKTPSTFAAAAAARFEEDGKTVLGTILNDWNPHNSGESASSYYSPYTSYYQSSNRTK